MRPSLRPGLTARLGYTVPAGRTAELIVVEGRHLTFAAHALDDTTFICRGAHRRAVIDAARFRARLDEWNRP